MISFLVVLVAISKYGPGMTFDSANYIAVSRNMIAGNGVNNSYGEPFISQPPMYPATVALLSWLFGVDPIRVVGVYNASLFAIMACSSIWLLRGFAKIVLWEEAIFFVVVLSSKALLGVSVMVFSDILFIEMCFLFLIFLKKYLQQQKAVYFLFFMTFASLACLTRYTGVVLILTGACVLLVSFPKSLRQLARIPVFGIIASLPLAFWLYRNYRVAGSLVGIRGRSIYSLSDNLFFTMKNVAFWFFPGSNTKLFLSLSVLAILLVWCIFLVKNPVNGLKRIIKKYWLLILFVCIYLLFLVSTSSLQAVDRINDRLLAPIFVPLWMLLLLSFKSTFPTLLRRNENRNGIVFGMLLSVLFFSLSSNVVHRYREVSYMVDNGAGGNNVKHWHESALIKCIKSNGINTNFTVYSNAPELVYLQAERECLMLPQKRFYNSPDSTGLTLDTLKKYWPRQDTCYIVWINNEGGSTLFDLSELSQLANFERMRSFEDGEIIKITRKPKDIL